MNPLAGKLARIGRLGTGASLGLLFVATAVLFAGATDESVRVAVRSGMTVDEALLAAEAAEGKAPFPTHVQARCISAEGRQSWMVRRSDRAGQRLYGILIAPKDLWFGERSEWAAALRGTVLSHPCKRLDVRFSIYMFHIDLDAAGRVQKVSRLEE